MKINFMGLRIDAGLEKAITRAVKTTLSCLEQKDRGLELNINFVTAPAIQRLNRETRGIDAVTDVLSYPNFSIKPFETLDINDRQLYAGGSILLGDMAICLSRARKQAREFNNTFEGEVVKLVVHSTLHIMGFDHIADEDYVKMQAMEDKVALLIKGGK